MSDTVIIALCSFNGGRWLAEQLDSIAAQTHKDWQLWISDDGSRDDTRAVVAAFQAKHPEHNVKWVEGPRQGGAQNFMSLICHPALPVGQATHLALCDQDDVWLPHKLAQGLAMLRAQPDADIPLIYGAQSRHIDLEGRVIGHSRRPRQAVSIQNAFVQNMVSGHSLILNPAALALAREVGQPAEAGPHDWWLSLLVLACGGRAVVDTSEVLFYRQHGANVMGAPQGGSAALRRLGQLRRGIYKGWIEANLNGLAAISEKLTPEARHIVNRLRQPKAGQQQTGLARVKSYRELGIVRQSKPGTAFLYLAALFGMA